MGIFGPARAILPRSCLASTGELYFNTNIKLFVLFCSLWVCCLYIRMAEQKQENSEAVEEEEAEEDGKAEITNLNTPCSESTVETEHPEVLGGDGQLTPEGESCGYLQSEESSGRLDSSHTVTSTVTVSLALPALPAGQYLTQVFLRTLLLLHRFVWP